MRTYISPYGNPLVYTGEPGERPILTCENYCKWYALFAVLPDGTIDRVDFPGQDDRFPDSEITPGVSGFCDHVPNPDEVLRMAEKLGWDVDTQAHEMIVGRWAIEYLDQFKGVF
jgi:hypothetical protein